MTTASYPKVPHLTDTELNRGIRWSLYLHGVFAVILILKQITFGDTVPYTPTLRVDLVALPDTLKKDLTSVPPEKGTTAEDSSSEASEEELEPGEMASQSKSSKKPKKEHKEKNRAHSMRNAIERIKALNKIKSLEKSNTEGVQVKGNVLSPGTSLSGEAREAAEASYYDALLDQLKPHWALPPWIERQRYSAQARVFLDANGRVIQIKIQKPSGNAQFDDAVRQAILSAAPFPPIPDGLTRSLQNDGVLLGFPL